MKRKTRETRMLIRGPLLGGFSMVLGTNFGAMVEVSLYWPSVVLSMVTKSVLGSSSVEKILGGRVTG